MHPHSHAHAIVVIAACVRQCVIHLFCVQHYIIIFHGTHAEHASEWRLYVMCSQYVVLRAYLDSVWLMFECPFPSTTLAVHVRVLCCFLSLLLAALCLLHAACCTGEYMMLRVLAIGGTHVSHVHTHILDCTDDAHRIHTSLAHATT